MGHRSDPIGIFDSGVGGLSVLKELWRQMPGEEYIYLADQAHVPYGQRSLGEVRSFSEQISRYLMEQSAKLVVVACNTASAAALYHLRQTFPDVPFVGMEPAVKPAAEFTDSGVVGVLATPATFQGALYNSVVERFAHGVQILQDTCPGLVDQIEAGSLESEETATILKKALEPMLAANIDTVVLGCTHYPFVIPVIESIAGPHVRVIDPAPAVARQVERLLTNHHLERTDITFGANPSQNTRFLSSGSPKKMKDLVQRLLNENIDVQMIQWAKGKIVRANPGTSKVTHSN